MIRRILYVTVPLFAIAAILIAQQPVTINQVSTNGTPVKVDGSGVTQPVSGTFWQATQPVSGTFWQATQPVSGTFWQATQPVSYATTGSGTATGAVRVELANNGTGVIGSITNPVPYGAATSTTTTMQNAVTGSGNGTDLTVDGMSVAIITANCATCSGGTTISFTASQDASNYAPIFGQLQTTGAYAQSTTTSGITVWLFTLNGQKRLRAAVGSYSAGTITVTGTTIPVGAGPGPAPIIYNSGGVTCTNGNPCDLQVDSKGNLFGTIRDAAANGRGANVTANNELNVIDPTSGATGAAFPAKATALGTKQGSGNLAGLITCDLYKFDRSTTADVQLVAVSGNTTIYVCGYAVTGESTTGSDVSLEYGTGSNCGTGTTGLTPPRTVGTSTSGAMIGGAALPPGVWSGLKTPASQALCVHRSAAQTTEIEVWYTQF